MECECVLEADWVQINLVMCMLCWLCASRVGGKASDIKATVMVPVLTFSISGLLLQSYLIK